ncbi:MAG TPA: M28 family peptidase [candidate division Zixibacteria bacterium]|nr:M28 family peptidase [candidate division Zixibacteria bacterium]
MLNTLKKIAFERVGGTPEELKALKILAEEVRARGVETHLEPFKVRTFRFGKGSAEILSDPPQSFKANPIGLTGSVDIAAKARYVEIPNLENMDTAEGEILLIHKRMTYDIYRNLKRLNPSAFMLINEPGKTPGYPIVKESLIYQFGKIPSAVISYEAALKIISAKEKIRLTLEQEDFEGTSHNLVAVIRGEIRDEEIVIGAHADSVASSPGAVDNGAGCVEMLGLIGHFAKEKPRRTLRFIFFGSEELGLLGSREYVRVHKDELEKIRLMVNLDMGGDIFGEDKAIITGANELATYIDSRNKLTGMGLRVSRGIYSSDNMPFAWEGIPAISFGRMGLGASMGHSSDDDLRNVDENSLRSIANIAMKFVSEIANARQIPFERAVPNDIMEQIDDYFYNKNGEKRLQ